MIFPDASHSAVVYCTVVVQSQKSPYSFDFVVLDKKLNDCFLRKRILVAVLLCVNPHLSSPENGIQSKDDDL